MARLTERLNSLAVSRAKQPGLYADGRGLYLQVKPSTSGGADQKPIRSWVFRFMLKGQARSMGLGPLDDVTLAEARQEAQECRRLLRRDGKDPIEARRHEKTQALLNDAKTITFKDAAERYIKSHKAGWRNEKHAEQWSSTLATYAYPLLGKLSIQDIDTTLMMNVLEQDVEIEDGKPISLWAGKTETAKRVRGRIEAILDWATARKLRTGDNPARWRGHLSKLLPAPNKVSKVVHHAALPYDAISDFIVQLRSQSGTAARALEFLILTGARTGEVIGAKWEEIDIDKALWIVPATRIKGEREHRVPLSAAALAIVKAQKEVAESDYVFPGQSKGEPLSNMSMLALLRRMKRDDLTSHGFRSSFRDWAAERTNYPHEVAEMALAHAVGDKVEQAYRRGDLFEKRRRLMDDWARFCEAPMVDGKVVAIRG